MQWGHLLSDCHKGTSTFITGSQSARRYFVIIKMMQQASGRQVVLLVDVLGRHAGWCMQKAAAPSIMFDSAPVFLARV